MTTYTFLKSEENGDYHRQIIIILSGYSISVCTMVGAVGKDDGARPCRQHAGLQEFTCILLDFVRKSAAQWQQILPSGMTRCMVARIVNAPPWISWQSARVGLR